MGTGLFHCEEQQPRACVALPSDRKCRVSCKALRQMQRTRKIEAKRKQQDHAACETKNNTRSRRANVETHITLSRRAFGKFRISFADAAKKTVSICSDASNNCTDNRWKVLIWQPGSQERRPLQPSHKSRRVLKTILVCWSCLSRGVAGSARRDQNVDKKARWYQS